MVGNNLDLHLKYPTDIHCIMWWNQKPKFSLKVKQNRYERFIVDELRIDGVSKDELADVLIEAIEEITAKLDALNGVTE